MLDPNIMDLIDIIATLKSRMTPVQQTPASRTYTTLFLSVYDFFILWISNEWVWKCSTTEIQLPLFKSTMGERHLDIGVGTGFYPSLAVQENLSCKEITLVDLNSNALEKTARRISEARSTVTVNTYAANATEPLPLPTGAKFDSVSMFFLLHCVSGPPERKNKVFDVVREHVADDGVLVGTTILGEESPMSWLARGVLTFYNRKGIFDNWKDSRSVFEVGLRRNFDEVDIKIVGTVMMFTARKPKAGGTHKE